MKRRGRLVYVGLSEDEMRTPTISTYNHTVRGKANSREEIIGEERKGEERVVEGSSAERGEDQKRRRERRRTERRKERRRGMVRRGRGGRRMESTQS